MVHYKEMTVSMNGSWMVGIIM